MTTHILLKKVPWNNWFCNGWQTWIFPLCRISYSIWTTEVSHCTINMALDSEKHIRWVFHENLGKISKILHKTRENLFMLYANNKGADRPAHPRSLISTFVIRCLDSIIPLVSISKISSLQLASVAEQAGLSLLWMQTRKTGFLVTRLISCRYSLKSPSQCASHEYPQLMAFNQHSHMTLKVFHWTYRKRHRVKICDKWCYQRSACKRALDHLECKHYLCRHPLQNSPLENVAKMSHFLSVSC